jgi:hypothetical protein
MRIEPANPALKWFIVFMVSMLMSLTETFLPDPYPRPYGPSHFQ